MNMPLFSSPSTIHKQLTADNQPYSEMKTLSKDELLEIWAHSEEVIYAMKEKQINVNVPNFYSYTAVWELQCRAYASTKKTKLRLQDTLKVKKRSPKKTEKSKIIVKFLEI